MTKESEGKDMPAPKSNTRDRSWYQAIGREGGRKKSATKGFGSSGLASLAGRIGGAVGRVGGHKLTARQKKQIAEAIKAADK
jgi:hypothetical protein